MLETLSDEEKIRQAIEYVACGHPLPAAYESFLKEAGLYEAITNPRGTYGDTLQKKRSAG